MKPGHIKSIWVKTTPYGDYKSTKDRVNSRTNRQVMIIREAQALGINKKHVGSKSIYILLNSIAKAHKAVTKNKEVKDK